MTQTEKFLTGARCSQGSSDLAVFESCSMWPKIRQSKIIPVGFYFVAGILAGRLKQKADLVPGIFIQGYRPHSSNGLFSSEKRGYGALLVKPESDVKTAPADLVLCEANVYQMKEDDRFELVLMNSEWRHPEAVKQFMVRLRREHRLEEITIGVLAIKIFAFSTLLGCPTPNLAFKIKPSTSSLSFNVPP